MDKQSNVLKGALGGAVGTLAGIAALNVMKTDNRADILQKVMAQKKLKDPQKETSFPVKVIEGFPNAFYVKGGAPLSTRQRERIHRQAASARRRGNQPLSDALLATEEMVQKPNGGIILGEPFNNMSILKHEEGHAKDKSWLSSIAPKVEKAWGEYNLNLLGTLTALGVSAYSPKHSDLAMGTNLAIQGLSTIPTLYSEWKASDYAKKHPGVSSNLLDETYNSYLISKIGNRLFLPSAAFIGTKLGESLI